MVGQMEAMGVVANRTRSKMMLIAYYSLLHVPLAVSDRKLSSGSPYRRLHPDSWEMGSSRFERA